VIATYGHCGYDEFPCPIFIFNSPIREDSGI